MTDWWVATLWAQVVATGMMARLIWFVQIVHYPLLGRVGEVASERFSELSHTHASRTTLVVAPLMLIEVISAGVVLVTAPNLWSIAGAAILAMIWISTFGVQVPLHARLARGFDASVHRLLLHSNWVRTFAWSARLPIAIALLASGGSGADAA